MDLPEILNWIKKAQKGDKDAFGHIYKHFLKKIYRYIYFSVHSKEVAEDLTQTTFLKAWRSLATFSPSGGTLQAYLFAIARNAIIDYYRRKKEVLGKELGEHISESTWANPEELFAKDETASSVWQAIKRLEEIEKNVIIMRYFEELDYAEIARIISKQEGAVRVMIYRILKKLKIFLED
ncbi:MAG: sigma-70 family RNA polymerase sigma factor [Candidatus Levybacteria bacterium]|nr:sigma-70 family RNA polymerase sigma factor [Candidatus Levybacteria bacterium]